MVCEQTAYTKWNSSSKQKFLCKNGVEYCYYLKKFGNFLVKEVLEINRLLMLTRA